MTKETKTETPKAETPKTNAQPDDYFDVKKPRVALDEAEDRLQRARNEYRSRMQRRWRRRPSRQRARTWSSWMKDSHLSEQNRVAVLEHLLAARVAVCSPP